jgi:hypothetical protein
MHSRYQMSTYLLVGDIFRALMVMGLKETKGDRRAWLMMGGLQYNDLGI